MRPSIRPPPARPPRPHSTLTAAGASEGPPCRVLREPSQTVGRVLCARPPELRRLILQVQQEHLLCVASSASCIFLLKNSPKVSAFCRFRHCPPPSTSAPSLPSCSSLGRRRVRGGLEPPAWPPHCRPPPTEWPRARPSAPGAPLYNSPLLHP